MICRLCSIKMLTLSEAQMKCRLQECGSGINDRLGELTEIGIFGRQRIRPLLIDPRFRHLRPAFSNSSIGQND